MDQDDDIDTAHPWLVIPYFKGDEGRTAQRPLTKVTPPVISWLCPAIQVQGVNYSATPGTYLPDQPLQITVDVDNRGVPNALVKLQVYWSDPATGFASQQLILSATQPVAGRSVAGPTRFPPMVWTPQQASIPPHFCLLARASCTPPEPDPGPAAPSPVDNRHWAQYNLQSALVSAAGDKSLVFWAGNPLPAAGAFLVTVRPMAEDGLRRLARLIRAEPVMARPHQLALYRAADADAARRRQTETSVVLELQPGERQALVLTAQQLQLAPQQFTAVEMVQTRVGREHGDGATGSLGVVLFGHVAR
ncbi:hypothetical protein [Duganella callida]|uniref:Uncharacterized protein n=1 Tax=Duganella callida TaxID=2561932 RepID=A0A4Y9SSL6_9BURK|nr:hypothetical protein [Duganella callida]TFW29475.1 hypothetical protein E4L98_03855 [Duganella callida]